MKKKHIEPIENEENAFALSTGDLMASLLFIFILLLMNALLQVKEQEEVGKEALESYQNALLQVKKQEKIGKEALEGYQNVKTQLYIDLQKEFKEDLKVWRAIIDSTLCIRFQEPSMLFDEGYDILKPNFKKILDDFFPRYIKVLNKPEYRDHIEEIRIEGHTNSNGEYYSNMKLSQDRTRTVLQYCFNTMEDEELISWLKGLVTANGLSSSRPIYNKVGLEDKELSRRVEFRVKTNAEKYFVNKIENLFKGNE